MAYQLRATFLDHCLQACSGRIRQKGILRILVWWGFLVRKDSAWHQTDVFALAFAGNKKKVIPWPPNHALKRCDDAHTCAGTYFVFCCYTLSHCIADVNIICRKTETQECIPSGVDGAFVAKSLTKTGHGVARRRGRKGWIISLVDVRKVRGTYLHQRMNWLLSVCGFQKGCQMAIRVWLSGTSECLHVVWWKAGWCQMFTWNKYCHTKWQKIFEHAVRSEKLKQARQQNRFFFGRDGP